MTEPPLDPDTDHDVAAQPRRAASTATPRWVKVAGVVALVVVLVFLALLLSGGGDHGPTRHTQLSTVTASIAAQP